MMDGWMNKGWMDGTGSIFFFSVASLVCPGGTGGFGRRGAESESGCAKSAGGKGVGVGGGIDRQTDR